MGHRPHRGARLIPLSQLPERLSELDGHAQIVTHCHHGARSMKALEILKGAGFGKVGVWGGIDVGRAGRTRGGTVLSLRFAEVVELVDALRFRAQWRKPVRVRVPPSALAGSAFRPLRLLRPLKTPNR